MATKKPENLGANEARTPQGRFAKGVSGNPRGKPKGTKHKATMAALSLLENESEALTRKAVEMALTGDTTALRLCLERLVPPCREMPLPSLNLPSVGKASDLPKLSQKLLESLAGGELLPSQAAAISALVGSHAKALELHELESRISALEADNE